METASLEQLGWGARMGHALRWAVLPMLLGFFRLP
uniref:Uncharacterized protein n=1 Tax=Arundo donax TaxID=35708 RepID=A0A0A9B9U3_ARUDO